MPVPGLELTVAQVVAHAANGPFWYAVDVWSGPADDAAFDVTVKADAPNAAILLPGLPNQRGWRWHCAPLTEWDGTPPSLG